MPEIPRLRGVTHMYAFYCATVAAALLVVFAPGGVARGAGAVYGIGLCALFGGSALYHRWRWNPRWRPILQRIDHSTIFLFIAASYTPVCLLVLSGTVRLVVLVTVWVGALGGVALSLAWITAPRVLASACYVALGWVAIIAFPQLVSSLPAVPLVLIATGGVLYTVGAVVFSIQRPNPWPHVFGFHEIFHAFVVVA